MWEEIVKKCEGERAIGKGNGTEVWGCYGGCCRGGLGCC